MTNWCFAKELSTFIVRLVPNYMYITLFFAKCIRIYDGVSKSTRIYEPLSRYFHC